MSIRHASGHWEGTLREGKGTMKIASEQFVVPMTWSTRFGDENGANPEEVIGAALAGCFSMKLSGDLTAAEFPPTSIDTTVDVHFEKTDAGFRIVKMVLHNESVVPGIDEAKFQEVAEGAKKNCPISNALSMPIELEAKLV